MENPVIVFSGDDPKALHATLRSVAGCCESPVAVSVKGGCGGDMARYLESDQPFEVKGLCKFNAMFRTDDFLRFDDMSGIGGMYTMVQGGQECDSRWLSETLQMALDLFPTAPMFTFVRPGTLLSKSFGQALQDALDSMDQDSAGCVMPLQCGSVITVTRDVAVALRHIGISGAEGEGFQQFMGQVRRNRIPDRKGARGLCVRAQSGPA